MMIHLNFTLEKLFRFAYKILSNWKNTIIETFKIGKILQDDILKINIII